MLDGPRSPAPCSTCECIDYIRITECAAKHGSAHQVTCTRCGASVSRPGRDHAIETWNTQQARSLGGGLHHPVEPWRRRAGTV